jgi:hypothetical protein
MDKSKADDFRDSFLTLKAMGNFEGQAQQRNPLRLTTICNKVRIG